jgi:glycosyltransferase 2 family protein
LKTKFFLIVRILFVLGLLTWLLYRMDPGQIAGMLRELQFLYFVPVFALITLESLFRCYNWMLLLRCKGAKIRFSSILYAYLAGAFFGTFIPSSMGVDLTRFLFLSRSSKVRTQDAAVTVVALNVLSLLILCITVSVCALLLAPRVEFSSFLYFLAAGSFAAPVGFCLVYYFQTPLRTAVSSKLRGRILDKIWALVESFSVFQHHYLLLGKVGILTLLNLLLSVLTVYFISLATYGDIPFFYFLLLMPVINLTRLIPHSIAGLGGEQGIFVFLFTSFGFREEAIFLISLFLSASVMLFILSGGLLYLGKQLAGRKEKTDVSDN